MTLLSHLRHHLHRHGIHARERDGVRLLDGATLRLDAHGPVWVPGPTGAAVVVEAWWRGLGEEGRRVRA